jgi:hypothetical protein
MPKAQLRCPRSCIILDLEVNSGEKKTPKMTYSSSLTDAEWEIIEPLLPLKKKLNLQRGQKEKF